MQKGLHRNYRSHHLHVCSKNNATHLYSCFRPNLTPAVYAPTGFHPSRQTGIAHPSCYPKQGFPNLFTSSVFVSHPGTAAGCSCSPVHISTPAAAASALLPAAAGQLPAAAAGAAGGSGDAVAAHQAPAAGEAAACSAEPAAASGEA